MKTQTTILFAVIFLFSLNFASALIVDADYVKIFPGDEASISIEVENNENFDIEKVSVGINLGGLPFVSVGSSEKDLDDLDEDDDDSATFRIKANSDAAPGSYEIPYTVRAVEDGNADNKITKNGTFGITIGAKTELSFDTVVEKNVVGEQGQVSIKIINSGLGSIGFVNVRIANVNGFEILGSSQEYVGEVDSDDFELATFDVKFLKETASVGAVVTYKDFDNVE